ncbi:putative disease resistance RPP13-like protein 1 [Cocos nucifera]|uniref:Putative disease resistance RPP13-like protein 1 n=1 Tax=Cocos nucifera TaxID=13894 RepID=A0A8K0IKH5_COCNU|nr:putative disease resistance RPP13-like protein 1 [Cocos nucifera]
MSMILGVEHELKKLRRRVKRISGFLPSAERERYKNQSINYWVVELKDVMYDADDIIDRCMMEGRRLLEDHRSESVVRRPSYLFSCFRHEISNEIVKLNDRLKEIEEDRSKLPLLENTKQSTQDCGVNPGQTFPDVVKSDIVGTQIEEATQSLVESLIKEDNKKYQVLGIVGMGGIGKTTLASNIYNHETIKNNFPIRVWVCVSKDFSDIKLLKNIIRGAGGRYKEDETKAELVPRLSSLLSRRFFIILDDIWRTELWEDMLRIPFENATAKGKIVITTRYTSVAKNMRAEIHHVDKMDNDSGWKLLRKKVFGDDEEEEEGEISRLREIGVKIVRKCHGLPLAIKAIAGVLRSKGTSITGWDMVLESDAWSLSRLEEELPGALFLSYEDLPSDLKQCFLYCSLFPEDSRMHREDLIRYWVAEGFVKSTQGNTLMEDVAEDYYRELIWRNLLDGHDDDDTWCTMHALLRSLALFLARDESTFLGEGRSFNKNPLTKLRRLSMVNLEERVEVPDAVKQQKCLRTLILERSPRTKMIENELFEGLRFLRIITIDNTSLERLPNSIGDLLHLRYLDLDRTKINELPESIGCLIHLQVLNLSGCESLHTLPKAITKLCNLRCLRLRGTPLTHVPKGIGKLKHLNHLEGFVMGHDDRRDAQDDDGCDLKELQSLSQLRFLEINRLERTQPAGAPVLANRSFLRTLILNCEQPEGEVEAIAIQRIDKIYDELSPQSTHLHRVEINNFFGSGFPSWMMSPSLDVSFPNLTNIRLFYCKSCPQLPPLGLLPQLKYLHVGRAGAIKTIGPEFLGPRASSAATSFPKLEELEFEYMLKWEEWSFGMVEGVGEERRGAPKLLPRLMMLKLRRCPKLRALPPLGLLPQLKSLTIDGAHAIKTIGPEFLGPRASSAATSFPKLQELMLADMKNWKEWSFGMVEGVGEERRGAPKLLPHLRKLELDGCPKLRALPPLGLLPQLKSLTIDGAHAIKTIGPEFVGPRVPSAATSFPKLEKLYFSNMSNWEEWSFGMVEGVGEERREAPKLLPHLRKLELDGCPKLRALPPLGLLPQLKSLEIKKAHAIKTIGPEFVGPRASSAATSFPKLEELIFKDMDNWEEWSFGLVEGVGEERRGAPKLLPHLRKLELDGCPKLRALPPLGLLPQLKSLEIKKAHAIKTIGPEFVGPRASSAATSFPKLEELIFKDMDNWEEWSFGLVEGVGEERRGAPKLLPHLRKLELDGCPKLRALPEGLWHATNLQKLRISNADDLKEINNLPSLKSLQIIYCRMLEHVENLDKLQFLTVETYSTTDGDGQRERLPQWLLEQLQNAPAAMQNLQKFDLTCSLLLLKTFLKDGPNWPIIQPIPQVRIQEYGRRSRRPSYIRYTKDPPTFKTHIEEES